MSRNAPGTRIPGYCLWKTRNVGYVRLDGRRKVLPGPYGSPESRAAYDVLIAAWTGNGRSLAGTSPVLAAALAKAHESTDVRPAPAPIPTTSYTVVEFVRDFMNHAKIRYAKHRDCDHFKEALRPVLKRFADLPLAEFGPKRLRECREVFVGMGLCRREVNRRVRRIQKAVAWAVSDERCPGEVSHRLIALEPLRRGEVEVRESIPVQPVEVALVDATLPHLLPEIAAMVLVQKYTGARSGEVVEMREGDIDRAGDVWVYKPRTHKTAWRGH